MYGLVVFMMGLHPVQKGPRKAAFKVFKITFLLSTTSVVIKY